MARSMVKSLTRPTTKASSSSFHTTTTTMGGQDEVIRVLSERTMIRGLEGPVERLMERVQTRVRKQPGLISFQALVDADEPCKFLVLTRWSSQHHLDAWLAEKDYQTAVAVSPFFFSCLAFLRSCVLSLSLSFSLERECSQHQSIFEFFFFPFLLFFLFSFFFLSLFLEFNVNNIFFSHFICFVLFFVFVLFRQWTSIRTDQLIIK